MGLLLKMKCWERINKVPEWIRYPKIIVLGGNHTFIIKCKTFRYKIKVNNWGIGGKENTKVWRRLKN